MAPRPKPGFVAETPRQEGSQGRLGRAPEDTLPNGEIDTSDPNSPPIDAPNSTNDQKGLRNRR
jgi:hypothetical protein